MTAPRRPSASGRGLAVVLLNWNRPELTIEAGRSAMADLGAQPGWLVIVDNGSVDDSVTRLRIAFPAAQIIENGENLGFARGVNRGVAVALDEGADHVLILNNDATLIPGSIAKATAVLGAHPDIGIVGGKILTGDGRLWFTGAKMSLLTGGPVIRDQLAVDDGRWDFPHDVEGITMAYAFVARRAFEAVGLLCEDYAFGQEEWDFCHHVRRAGFRCRFEPKVAAVHEGDGSHANDDPRFVYLGYRNKLTYQRRVLPGRLFWPWLGLYALYAATQAADPGQRRRGRVIADLAMRRRCAIAALVDFLRYGTRIEFAHADAFVGRASSPAAGAP